MRKTELGEGTGNSFGEAGASLGRGRNQGQWELQESLKVIVPKTPSIGGYGAWKGHPLLPEKTYSGG